MEGLQTAAAESSFADDQQFHLVANSVAKLVETARRELGRDQEAAKASLVTASHILQAEIERCSAANGSTRGGLAAWQIARVRAYIDRNLHRTIHIRDLSAVARRSKAHFSRKFKLAVGESPHAFVVSRRLERASHLMMTSAASLSEIALSVGFSIKHIYAGSSDRLLAKVRPTGDASAESLTRSAQEPAWTRISHE